MVDKTPFTIAAKKINYIGINLTRNVQNSYQEKVKKKTLLKDKSRHEQMERHSLFLDRMIQH